MNFANASIDVLAARAAVATTTLKLLANEARLLLLCRLTLGEAPVGDLVAHLGQSQSSVSQHLARLRDGGLVLTRRDGTVIYYRLADAGVGQLIDALCDRFGGD
ncbi:MAG: ArsR/SmtB family transcription factor [Polymorphobacter sp.]